MSDAEVDDAVLARQRAKEARRTARTQAIKSDIQEIIPVRRRDKTDAFMAKELAEENRSRLEAVLRDDGEDVRQRDPSRERRKNLKESQKLRVSYDPALGEDPDLSAAAPRTPMRTRSASSAALSGSLGYAAPVATVTMQPMAASYFRGGAIDLAATVMPMAPPAQAANAGSGLPPRIPLPFGRGSASGGPGGVAASSTARYGVVMPRVYEESIATGDFRRVDAGIMAQAANQLGAKLGPSLSFSATFLRARQQADAGGGCLSCLCGGVGGKAGVNELDANERESMYGSVGLGVQSGCRIAQGLLAGTLLVIVLQLDRLSDPIQFVQFMAPVLPPLRIMMYVLSVLAFLGSAEQAMETRNALGAWSAAYAVINDAASLRLSSTVRYTWIATLAYLGTCVTVFAAMPMDSQLKVLGAERDVTLRLDKALPDLVSSWKGLLGLRFALVLIGMLASMAAASTPTDVYRAMKQAEDVDADLVAASAAAAAAAAAAGNKGGQGAGASAPSMDFGQPGMSSGSVAAPSPRTGMGMSMTGGSMSMSMGPATPGV